MGKLLRINIRTNRRRIVVKRIVALVLTVAVLSLVGMVAVAYATSTTGTDPFASMGDQTGSLTALATGNLGKFLFFVALLIGIVCLLFTKHRIMGMIALVFGFLLGAYSGIANGLWNWFIKL